jgi:glycerophosphoryl diester phosphodiesterase
VRNAAPENTMAAFELAASQGADGIELDVRTCKTGEVVVCHDPTLARVSNGRDARVVAELSAAELQAADVGQGQPVPLLCDVLSWARARGLKVNVEMKHDVPARRQVVQATARALSSASPDEVIVSSFDPLMLGYFAWLDSRLPSGYLFARDQHWRAAGWLASGLRTTAVHPDRACVDPAMCQVWRSRGHTINVWTVNEPAEAIRLAALGVDALISDVPGAIAQAVR